MRDQIYAFSGVSAVHDSGTKYYQIIRISKLGSNRGILVTHWGKRHPGAPGEPKNHGQSKIECVALSLVAAFNEKLNMKKKRGYSKFDSSLNKQLGIADTHLELSRLFSSTDVSTIVGWLDSIDAEDVERKEEDDSAPVVKSTLAIPLHEQWGTW